MLPLFVLNRWGYDKFPKETPLVFYHGGQPIFPPIDMLDGLKVVLENMVSYIQKEVPGRTFKFWRLQSPRHFYGGEWNQNGSCVFSEPLQEFQVCIDDDYLHSRASLPWFQVFCHRTHIVLIDVKFIFKHYDFFQFFIDVFWDISHILPPLFCSNLVLIPGQLDLWFDPRNKGVNKEARQLNHLVEDALQGTGIRLLDLTHLSEFRVDAHPAIWLGKKDAVAVWGQDCMHWCLPGVPDTWVDVLSELIRGSLETG